MTEAKRFSYVMYEIRPLDQTKTFSYIGSTINFTRRKCEHKNVCYNNKKREYNTPLYQYIRDNGGWEEFEMVPIEEYSCDTTIQAKIREQHWIEERKQSKKLMNTVSAYVDTKEYNRIRNATEERKQLKRDYLNQHRDEIYEHRKEKITCECGLEIARGNLWEHKKSIRHQTYLDNLVQNQNTETV